MHGVLVILSPLSYPNLMGSLEFNLVVESGGNVPVQIEKYTLQNALYDAGMSTTRNTTLMDNLFTRRPMTLVGL